MLGTVACLFLLFQTQTVPQGGGTTVPPRGGLTASRPRGLTASGPSTELVPHSVPIATLLHDITAAAATVAHVHVLYTPLLMVGWILYKRRPVPWNVLRKFLLMSTLMVLTYVSL